MIPIIESYERVSLEKKIATLARFLSGNYDSMEQLLQEEEVSELCLELWRMEYNSKYYLYLSDMNNRDYNKKIKDLNNLAIISARGGSKGLKRKALRKLNGKPLIAYSIEACKQSKYIDKVLVSTDDTEIAEVAASYGAYVPFLRPDNLANDHADLSHVMVHAVIWMALVEDYWYDFIFNISPTYPLRTACDIDKSFEEFHKSDYRNLQSVDEMDHNPARYYHLQKDRLTIFPLKRKIQKKTYRQSSFIAIESRRPNYHLPFGQYETFVAPIKERLPFVVGTDKAVDVDSVEDLYLCESVLGKNLSQQSEIIDINERLISLSKYTQIKSNKKAQNILGIIRLDSVNCEYELDGLPIICKSTLAAMESTCFEELIVLGCCSHIKEYSKWAGIPYIKGKNIFRLDGYPHKKYLERCESMLMKKFRHVCVIDGRTPILQVKDIENLCSVYSNNNCATTISVSPPHVHPYWCKCIVDGRVVETYANPHVGQRQKLPDIYVMDRALMIAHREELLKGRHVHPKCGYFLNKGSTVHVETFLDYLKVISFIKAKRELMADSTVNYAGMA